MSDIKPALTPEDWKSYKGRPPSEVHLDAIMHFNGPHALVALALHGQPFGFTWDDYDRFDALAVEADLGNNRADPALVAWYMDFRDRIVALLPPREPGA